MSCDTIQQDGTELRGTRAEKQTVGVSERTAYESTKELDNVQKRAYGIVKRFDRMNHLLWGPILVHVFTHLMSLLYVFASVAMRPDSL